MEDEKKDCNIKIGKVPEPEQNYKTQKDKPLPDPNRLSDEEIDALRKDIKECAYLLFTGNSIDIIMRSND